MAGMGTGYPNWFKCPQGRRDDSDTHYYGRPRVAHTITLTRRTKPTKRTGKGHPRKSWTTFEWKCECGLSGWSSHIDLENKAIEEGWHTRREWNER